MFCRSRYALMPYIYTLFRAANTTGQPVVRPLWFEFPDNAETYGAQAAMLLGPAVLVAPVMQAGASSVEVLLPAGARWFDARSGAEVQRAGSSQRVVVPVDMESIPVFYR